MPRRAALLLAGPLLGQLASSDPAPGLAIFQAELLAKLEELTNEFQRVKEEKGQRIAKLKAESGHLKELLHSEQEGAGAPGRLLADKERTIAGTTDGTISDLQKAMTHTWLIICGALVMLMQAGFALLEAGSCRAKNVQNILMKNMTDVCLGTLCWWAFGWMFAYGDGGEELTRFAGYGNYFGHDFHQEPTVGRITQIGERPLNWFFQWAFCSAAATIVSGGIAERANFPGYVIYTAWMTTIIYPIVVAWTWSGNGWLQGGDTERINDVGYLDFAGSGIVHMCGGVSALVGAAILGPRNGRFDPERAAEFFPHSLPLVVMGTFTLWFGWYGFNCGSTLSMATAEDGAKAATVAMNTTIAAATGGMTVLLLRFALLKKYDVGGMCNGILAGLVSITAPCSNVEGGSAFVIAAFGGCIYQGASMALQKLKIDDPVDAFPVHGACGAWGVLCVSIFDWGDGIGIFHNGFGCVSEGTGCQDGARGKSFAANILGVIFIAVWSGLLSAIVMLPLMKAGIFRASYSLQDEGMDGAKHSPARGYQLYDPQGMTGTC